MKKIFKKLLKKEKSRVFLGTCAVVPRTDFKQFDEWGIFQKEDIDTEFRKTLDDIFSLPSASEVYEPKNNDLVLDVIVSDFQLGDAFTISLGIIDIPVFWRPKINVKSRLYSLKTNKTKNVFSISETMKWKDYVIRIFSLRGFFRFRPVFDKTDMNYLLYKACHKLLLEIKKSL